MYDKLSFLFSKGFKTNSKLTILGVFCSHLDNILKLCTWQEKKLNFSISKMSYSNRMNKRLISNILQNTPIEYQLQY